MMSNVVAIVPKHIFVVVVVEQLAIVLEMVVVLVAMVDSIVVDFVVVCYLRSSYPF
jgi:hypothetical protein